MLKYNRLIADGLAMATQAHEEGQRKASDLPYIVHPYEVALLLQKAGQPDKLIVAGLLHDTLEDTEIKEEDIFEEFGEDILQLVLGASERLENRDERSWEDRKEHTIKQLADASRNVKIVACADKLSNIWSMLRDYEKIGAELWERFNRGYPEQKWYYQNLVISLGGLGDFPLYQEFIKAVDALFID